MWQSEKGRHLFLDYISDQKKLKFKFKEVPHFLKEAFQHLWEWVVWEFFMLQSASSSKQGHSFASQPVDASETIETSRNVPFSSYTLKWCCWKDPIKWYLMLCSDLSDVLFELCCPKSWHLLIWSKFFLLNVIGCWLLPTLSLVFKRKGGRKSLPKPSRTLRFKVLV